MSSLGNNVYRVDRSVSTYVQHRAGHLWHQARTHAVKAAVDWANNTVTQGVADIVNSSSLPQALLVLFLLFAMMTAILFAMTALMDDGEKTRRPSAGKRS